MTAAAAESTAIDALLDKGQARYRRVLLNSELSRMVGVSESMVSLIASGRRTPSLDVFAALAEKLEVPMEELYRVLVRARLNAENERRSMGNRAS